MMLGSSFEETEALERYKFTISYNGTAFSGFQRQGGTRTVQLVLEDALRELGWEEDAIVGAGRTDAGVHAAGQVFSAALRWNHGTDALVRAMNAKLPDDVSILNVEQVPYGFSARYDALSRCYHYHIYVSPVRLPLIDMTAWQIRTPLSLEALNRITRHFTGIHDFRAFGSPPRKNHSTVREIFVNRWTKVSDDRILFEIEANAFLYHMVRRIVFLQTACAMGTVSEEAIINAVRYGIDAKPGLAPARGLRLQRVNYGSGVAEKAKMNELINGEE